MDRASRGLIAGVLLAACVHAPPASRAAAPRPPAAAADTATTTLNVINNYAVAVEVRVLASGTSYVVGRVFPGLTSRFTLPALLAGRGIGVVFSAKPDDGAPTVRSSPVRLDPGNVVDFTIAPDLVSSSATVRP